MYADGMMTSDEYLEHHGIKGQKWGVRRFQNYDGTRIGAKKVRRKFGEGKEAYTRRLLKDPSFRKQAASVTAAIDKSNRALVARNEANDKYRTLVKEYVDGLKNTDPTYQKYKKLAEESKDEEEKTMLEVNLVELESDFEREADLRPDISAAKKELDRLDKEWDDSFDERNQAVYEFRGKNPQYKEAIRILEGIPDGTKTTADVYKEYDSKQNFSRKDFNRKRGEGNEAYIQRISKIIPEIQKAYNSAEEGYNKWKKEDSILENVDYNATRDHEFNFERKVDRDPDYKKFYYDLDYEQQSDLLNKSYHESKVGKAVDTLREVYRPGGEVKAFNRAHELLLDKANNLTYSLVKSKDMSKRAAKDIVKAIDTAASINSRSGWEERGSEYYDKILQLMIEEVNQNGR